MARRNLNEDEQALLNVLRIAGGAIRNRDLLEELDWSEERLKLTKKALLRLNSIYITQEGVILPEFASEEQEVWHLGWSIGLFEVAGMHLIMDRELLLNAPQAFQTLINRGNFSSAEKLMAFRQRVAGAMDIPQQLLNIQRTILRLIDEEQENLRNRNNLRRRFPPHPHND